MRLKLKLNPCRVHVINMHDALKRTGGYCPCAVNPTEDDKCMCKEFTDKLNDPDFEGWCHCKLYYKEK